MGEYSFKNLQHVTGTDFYRHIDADVLKFAFDILKILGYKVAGRFTKARLPNVRGLECFQGHGSIAACALVGADPDVVAALGGGLDRPPLPFSHHPDWRPP